ncbi:MAG: VOC family protein [Nakamurella sp.]
MTESPHPDFGRAVERAQRAVAALLQGDPEPEKELWSRRDDVTLANPFGGYRRGWPDVEDGLDLAADGFAKGGTCVFEEISRDAGLDQGFVFEMERFESSLSEGRGRVSGALRVVMIFRLEDGEWKLVHRQADTLTEFADHDDSVHRPERRMKTLHTAYRVADLEVSLGFYTTLGYRELGRVDLEDGNSLTMLSFPGEDIATLELAHRPANGDVEIGTGFSHLVVQVDDLAATVEALTRAGLGPGPVEHHGATDGPTTSWLTDPDGYRIELVQWAPGHPDGLSEADFAR